MKNSNLLLLAILIIINGCSDLKKKDMSSGTLSNDDIIAVSLEKGELIAQASQNVLGTKLKSVIESEGIPAALRFCDINAYPLIDSLKEEYQAEIKRATLKARNSADQADQFETGVLNEYQQQISNGITPQSKVTLEGDQILFTKPIILNSSLCLNCHGEIGSDISYENYDVIKALYPDDNATHHKMGEIRGIWMIKFNKKSL